MPERLEDGALPGGSLLGLLFGVPLAEPFLGSVWADANPLGSDDLPGVEGRRREHLAALERLQRDRLLADELFGEVRRLVQIAGASTATVSINVYNNAPVANNDSYQTKHDVALNVSAPGVKSNDYDSDGDPMTAILVSGPSHALSFTFNYNGNGSFTYTPAYHYVGVDSFTYKVNDGVEDSLPATVSITVSNNPPVAVDDSGYIAASGVTRSVSGADGVLKNDYDPDGDTPLGATIATGASHGTVWFSNDGSFEYASNPGYAGTDSFTYWAFDGIATSVSTATVTITVFRVDHQTVATSPADRTRTKVGVGEVVDLTVVPPSVPGVEWHLFGGGAIRSNSGLSTTFTADERASESHVQAVVAGVSSTVHFNVVEPTGQTIEQEPGTGIWHIQGEPTCGFMGRAYILPDDVSFQNISVREGEVNAVATGYFAYQNGLVHNAGSWWSVNPPTPGKGGKVNATDTIQGGSDNHTPYEDGTFTWAIPRLFQVGSGSEKQFTTATQVKTIDSAGTVTMSKGGTTRSAALNDPTSNY